MQIYFLFLCKYHQSLTDFPLISLLLILFLYVFDKQIGSTDDTIQRTSFCEIKKHNMLLTNHGVFHCILIVTTVFLFNFAWL